MATTDYDVLIEKASTLLLAAQKEFYSSNTSGSAAHKERMKALLKVTDYEGLSHDEIKVRLQDLVSFIKSSDTMYTGEMSIVVSRGKHYLRLTTKDIILTYDEQTVNFGGIHVEYWLDQVHSRDHSMFYPGNPITQFQAVGRELVSGNPHPHISGNGLCFGDGQESCAKFMKSMDLVAVFSIIGSILNTYNPGSPYCKWENYAPKMITCVDCSSKVKEESTVMCNNCSRPYCSDCKLVKCTHCDRRFCHRCMYVNVLLSKEKGRIVHSCIRNCMRTFFAFKDDGSNNEFIIYLRDSSQKEDLEWMNNNELMELVEWMSQHTPVEDMKPYSSSRKIVNTLTTSAYNTLSSR